MFKRRAGWIIVFAGREYYAHYYKENQTKALCGHSNTMTFTLYPQQPSMVKSCKSCVNNLSKINYLHTVVK